MEQESISVTTVALVALLAPGLIIALICAFLVPGASWRRNLKRSQVVRRKLWEFHSGLAGLILSVALGFFVTQGVKNIFAKPRPHFLELCDPDLTNIASHVVGGKGQDISARWTLVSTSICRMRDPTALADGMRSFPSGHCSFSFGGLFYLSLFLCSKFAIAIPYLPLQRNAVINSAADPMSGDTEMLPMHRSERSDSKSSGQPLPVPRPESQLPLYNSAATPPNYGLLIVLIPLGVATYIASTRYTEFWHFGFDVISGSLVGILSAWFSFRWYHLPVRHGQGWAWGPRTRDRAFAIGVGVGNYVGSEGWESSKSPRRHVEPVQV